MDPSARFDSLDQAMTRLDALAGQAVTVPGTWSWAQVLEHCAQSIEYSLDGFPRLKPAIVRGTIGRLVAGRFLSRGYLGHDLAGPIPGAPTLASEDAAAAEDRLRSAIERFEQHEGPLQPHFIFGRLDKGSFARMHAMHLADHLAVAEPEA